jgi:glutathione S-transferase
MIGNGGGFYPSPYGQTPYTSVPNNFAGGSPSIPPYYGSVYQQQNPQQQQSHRHSINQANNGNNLNISSFKLYDLDTNTHNEIIRLIFSFARVPYKEKRIKQDEWNETKEQISVAQLPSLRINNQFKIFSLHAIIRHLAREFHLYGTGRHDQAIVDVVLETVRGLQDKIFAQVNHSDENLHQLITDHSSTYLNQLEKLYQIFNRHGPFYLGSHISIADLIVYDTINYLIHIDTKLLDNYSHLKEARRRLEKHTQISSYLNAKKTQNKIQNHKSPQTERLATKSPTPNLTSHQHRHRSHDGHKSGHHHHHHHHHHRHHHRDHSKDPTPSSQIKRSSIRSSTKSPSIISKKEKEPTPILQTKHRSVRSSKSPSISKKGKETAPPPPQTTDVKTPPVITEQKSGPIVN